ncbi:MAG: hypothetical protein LQ345_006642, partial [Seirophora villosa]
PPNAVTPDVSFIILYPATYVSLNDAEKKTEKEEKSRAPAASGPCYYITLLIGTSWT